MSLVRARGLNPAAAGLVTRDGEAYRMGPRINLRRSLESIGSLLRRADCVATDASNTCEKPVGASDSTLAIVLGIVIPVVVAIFVLIFLHRRNMRRDKLEELNDPTQDLDFGLGDGSAKKRKSLFGGGEKALHKGGLSMDMNLSSPYLLPPGNTGSRESIHSYARTLQTENDPYRTVSQYATSDVGSVRSFNPDSPAGRRPPKSSGLAIPPTTPRAPSSDEKDDPFATPTAPKPTHQLPPSSAEVHDVMVPVQPIVPEIETVGPVDVFNADEFEMPDIPAPAPAALKLRQDGARSPSHMEQPSSARSSAYTDNGRASHVNPADSNIPQILSPGQPAHQDSPAQEEDGRGRRLSRLPQQGGGLGVPQNNGNKRLSVGFRPLPPSDEAMESDDPEVRANRIRSFYKEYFDDSNEAPPPMPTQPPQHLQQQQQQQQQQQPKQQPKQGGPDYYEDYDQGYLEAAAYYDADTNAFVMPYAQPVTRRAMTPPPSGRQGGPMGGPRGPGPRGPGFRGANGNGGTFSPGPGGRPRAGSAFGPRPDSSASARYARQNPQQPKKNLPPPAALTTLPTPSKLGDDSFAIFNAADFAPPTSIRDNVAGRSQSPFGERRPFLQPPTAASQLATAFEDLAPLPSPHSLRKSSTFTGLDFAPPKKFRDPENASDAGSIRSNKSGISQTQLNAIRSGAGRISRLPGDTVFTPAAMDGQLKPSWTLRP